MSRAGRIARRSFLVAAASVAGGAAFGYWQYRRDPANPLAAGEGEAVFNPWVVVRADGVTVITPRAEMGQGAQTTLAALVAEEMDLGWDQVRAEHGPAAAAYYNGFLGEAGLPFPDYADKSAMQEAAQDFFGAVAKLTGLQVTGGSSSVRDGFDRMRAAGATARAMLVRAAADRLGIDAASLKTEAGAVIAPDGSAITYGDLATEAAALDPPRDVAPKPRADWRLLGHDLPRLDMAAKATGTAGFGIDVRLPGMVHAAVRANPVLGAEIERFDAAEAKAMPGVHKVLDIGGAVAVIAADTWTAMRAAESIAITSAPAPYPEDTEAIFAKIAAAFGEAPNDTLRNDGGGADALTGEVIEAEYRVPYLAHACMEPMNATALLDGGQLTIWTGNQAPTLIRDRAAGLAGLDRDNVTVVTPFLGGGFGRRGEFDAAIQAVKIAMAVPGTPVKLTWSREEDMRHDFYRPAAIARMAGVMGRDTPEAFSARIAAPSVNRAASRRILGFAPPGPDRLLTEGAFDQPYHIPHHHVAGHIADVDVPVGFWRSVGNSHNAFFNECFLDELAQSKGLDPVAMRLRMLAAEHAPSAAVMERAAQMAGWGRPRPAGRALGAAFCYSFGSPVAQIVEVADEDGRIRIARVWAAVDVGTALDRRNIEAQVVSGIVYGLSAAVMGEITFAGGEVEQFNFPDYDGLRMHQMPAVEVAVLEANATMGGVGEIGTPPAAPALANAVFALTGKRVRTLPLWHHVDFV